MAFTIAGSRTARQPHVIYQSYGGAWLRDCSYARTTCECRCMRLVWSMASTLTPEYLAVLRNTTGTQRLRTAFGLYWSARKLKAARLRELHPDWSDTQVQQRVKEIFLHASS